MYSMYERLMNLPIFKGAGQELINDVAEKTPLEFKRFMPGDMIVSEDQYCNEVVCLMSGRVEQTRNFFCGNLIVSEITGEGSVIGLEHLFGLHKSYGVNVKAMDEAGVMTFSKAHYLRMLQNSQVMLLNYVNYISRVAQNGTDALRAHDLSIHDTELSYLVQVATSPYADKIILTTPHTPIVKFFMRITEDRSELFRRLAHQGILHFDDENRITVLSRSALLDAFRKERP